MRTTRGLTLVALAMTMLGLQTTSAQQRVTQLPESVATFKSSIDLVRISAFVRDRKGRFVVGLQQGIETNNISRNIHHLSP